jgi:hypothetical protein
MKRFSSILAGAFALATLSVLPGCGGGPDEPECSREPGPGCPAEALAESEPNDSRGAADSLAAGTQQVRIRGNANVTGTLTSAQDVDVYRMELATAQVVRLETFQGTRGQCPSSLDTGLVLQDAAGMQLTVDDDNGIGWCSAITVSLQPGTYYVQVVPVDMSSSQSYSLEVVLQEGVGPEYEPNETLTGATSLRGVDSFINGSITTSDADVFRLTLTERKSLRVELLEGASQKYCDARELDSVLELIDSTGAVLVSDDDDGRGYCSRIDGTGATPDDVMAANLPPGTYYLRVRSSMASNTFDYRLSVLLR